MEIILKILPCMTFKSENQPNLKDNCEEDFLKES